MLQSAIAHSRLFFAGFRFVALSVIRVYCGNADYDQSGEKKITMLGSFCLNINNNTGTDAAWMVFSRCLRDQAHRINIFVMVSSLLMLYHRTGNGTLTPCCCLLIAACGVAARGRGFVLVLIIIFTAQQTMMMIDPSRHWHIDPSTSSLTFMPIFALCLSLCHINHLILFLSLADYWILRLWALVHTCTQGDPAPRLPASRMVHANTRHHHHLHTLVFCCNDAVRGNADDSWQQQLRAKVGMAICL